ncbi:feruloyl esterase B precursor [Xylariales sp. PMI_506]|nr:feruloyl esterase B precursor [Xylariales sp. PMI_506]
MACIAQSFHSLSSWPVCTPSRAAAFDCAIDTFSSIIAGKDAATVKYAYAVTKGSSFGIPSPAFSENATDLPALCAVGINVKSSSNSSYNFGLFLPDTTWNDRFLAAGNGGFAGGINWPHMGTFSQYGFATMSTDTGHESPDVGEGANGAWGLNAPESIIDWGHRAMHGSVELSKHIISNYYAKRPEYSYFASCSTGGRQGLKETQLYPEDFDGISVGAPAWLMHRLVSGTLRKGLHNYPPGSAKHISPSLFPAIVSEIMRQCDPQDGVVDGIISDPDRCNFDFDALLCTATRTKACLSPAQLQTVYEFYSDYIDVNQTFVFPGMPYGADPVVLMSEVIPISIGYFRNWVYNDTDWDYTKFTYADVQNAVQIDPGDASADDYDLSTYRNRGGKIVMYHGIADPLITSESSKLFHSKITRRMGAMPDVTISDFYRLFLVPGMGHCSQAAVAPWYIAGGGQTIAGATHSVPGFEDADHDVILALMRWVENGTAPEKIIATKFVNDSAAQGVQNQRPLCVYPEQAMYTGSGNTSLPENWECRRLY